MSFLADFLGNIWFAAALVGGVGWLGIVMHMMNMIALPKMRR